jgi:GTP-binding protein
MNFIDHAKIFVQAGNGGNGCIAFLREKFRPKGGPCGGDGGKGGSVIFLANSNLSTLQDLTYNKKYFAKKGENGKGKNMHGKNGEDIYILVPEGTIVIDSNTKQVIADLVKKDQKYKIAGGGKRAFPNPPFPPPAILYF